jgi:hypothetical protein
MMLTRDNQRQAVYSWEDRVRHFWQELDPKLTLEECRKLIYRVWDDYRPGEQKPQIKDGRGRRSAAACRTFITLPCYFRKPIIVLHETAHSLLHHEKHGPLFATLLTELWERYLGIPAWATMNMGMTRSTYWPSDSRRHTVHFATSADTKHAIANPLPLPN